MNIPDLNNHEPPRSDPGKTTRIPTMKIYTVINRDADYQEEFTNLIEAKKAMREHNAKGFITKVWSNGDWENLGEIKLKSSNKTFVANTRQIKPSYN